MFPTVAIVEYIEEDHDYNRFYAQAGVTLTEEVDHAELRLKGVDRSVHAAPIMNAQAGPNTFHISGIGSSPFKVGDTIPAVWFPKRRKLAPQELKEAQRPS
jgi:hypothetical protein